MANFIPPANGATRVVIFVVKIVTDRQTDKLFETLYGGVQILSFF